MIVIFFFKQKTAYEMRISDWSDVCSSDLILVIDLQEPDPEDESGEKLIREPRVFINPVFSDESEEHSVYQEGCLSVPEQYAEVTRPAEVTVDWQDADGKHHRERMTGLMATCIPHEHAHPEGLQIGRASCRDRVCQ